MKDMEEYKVYETTEVPAIGKALIISALRMKKVSGIVFEHYIFIGKNKPVCISDTISCELGKEFDELTDADLNLLRDFVYKSTYDKLIAYLSDAIGDNVTMALLKSEFAVVELDDEKTASALTKLWVFGKFHDEITAISTGSRCYVLKEALLEIMKLPSIISTSIKG